MGYQFLGDGLVVRLLTRGPSVLLYTHLPQGKFVNKEKISESLTGFKTKTSQRVVGYSN